MHKVKQIKIVSSKNIEQAWIEGNSVQLINISEKAELCVEAVSRALIANKDGSFSLRNGPFMRRFLDGYYPMHVSMQVLYSGTGLQLASVSPGVAFLPCNHVTAFSFIAYSINNWQNTVLCLMGFDRFSYDRKSARHERTAGSGNQDCL